MDTATKADNSRSQIDLCIDFVIAKIKFPGLDDIVPRYRKHYAALLFICLQLEYGREESGEGLNHCPTAA